ncbi:CHAP domain-containing protein, partial [Streptomyces sp. NPDC085665]|uniref:CHAP domain-containing protein n=1 Tax=Streptomyces sp. NPDC085665 TaxID=3365735 RepID=UPI0037D5FABC
VGISVTADGQGYVAVSGAGQVYAYGSAVYRGNPSGFTGGIVGISVTADGQGYVAVSGAGQVYAYGSAVYRGNPSGFTGGIKGISVTADGQGYAAVSGTGQVYAYGTVRYWGNGDPGSDDGSATRSRVAAIAQAEFTNTVRNVEIGVNCNFYSGAVNQGAPACSGGPGWRAEAWCADFAKWVWQQAGANPAGLNPGAVSIRNGRTSTWHSGSTLSGVQVGDLIGWNFNDTDSGNDHVSIVVAVGPTFITTIDGNYSDRITKRTDVIRGNASISGYATMTL